MQAIQRDRLIEDHIYFSGAIVDSCFKEFDLAGTEIPYADLLGYAQVGLVEAAARYSPATGAAFTTFSFLRIRGAVLDGIRKTRRSRSSHRDGVQQALLDSDPESYRPGAFLHGLLERSDIELDELPSTTTQSPDVALAARRLRIVVLKAIDELPDVERTIILLFYYEGLNLERIGARLGYTDSYVGRIRLRAERLLSETLAHVADEYDLEVSR
jgi:RNA polymerase sigma factor for flagellar operon FliA